LPIAGGLLATANRQDCLTLFVVDLCEAFAINGQLGPQQLHCITVHSEVAAQEAGAQTVGGAAPKPISRVSAIATEIMW
jgi:hypothetical protein